MKNIILLTFLILSLSANATKENNEALAPDRYPYQDIFRYSKDVSILKETVGSKVNCFVEVKIKAGVLRSKPQLIELPSANKINVETCLPRDEAKRILYRLHND